MPRDADNLAGPFALSCEGIILGLFPSYGAALVHGCNTLGSDAFTVLSLRNFLPCDPPGGIVPAQERT